MYSVIPGVRFRESRPEYGVEPPLPVAPPEGPAPGRQENFFETCAETAQRTSLVRLFLDRGGGGELSLKEAEG